MSLLKITCFIWLFLDKSKLHFREIRLVWISPPQTLLCFFQYYFFFFPCGVWGCRSHISRCSPLAQEGGILRIRGVGNARMQHGGRKCVLWLAMKAEPWKPGSRREECPAMSHMTRDLKVMMAWTGAVLKPTQLWLICVKTKKKLSEREWQGQEEPLKCHSCPFEVWRHWHLFTLPTRGYGATARPRWHRLRLKSLAFNTIQTLTQAQQRDPLPTRHLSFVLNTNTPIRQRTRIFGLNGSWAHAQVWKYERNLAATRQIFSSSRFNSKMRTRHLLFPFTTLTQERFFQVFISLHSGWVVKFSSSILPGSNRECFQLVLKLLQIQ